MKVIGFLWVLNVGFSVETLASTRMALVVGVNQGDGYDIDLRYAKNDAERISDVLVSAGKFSRDNVFLLTNIDAAQLSSAIQQLKTRIQSIRGESLLLFFYSGHADASALHMQNTRYPMSQLHEAIGELPASTRVVILDACQSGVLTRTKGGQPAPEFTVQNHEQLSAKGLAVLTSSGAGEDSQESDMIKGSFFTHYLASALLGAADANNDQEITIHEAFHYARERTLAATTRTVAGPQHPTYQFDLRGRADLILSWPGEQNKTIGFLQFPEAGTYLIQKYEPEDAVVAEVTSSDAGRQIVLLPGQYKVTKRTQQAIFAGDYQVESGKVIQVESTTLYRLADAPNTIKGEEPLAFNAYMVYGKQSSVLNLGEATFYQFGLQRAFPPFLLSLRTGFAISSNHLDISFNTTAERYLETRNVFVSFGLGYALHIKKLITMVPTWQVGSALFLQNGYQARERENIRQLNLFTGPLTQVQIHVSNQIDVLGEAATSAYLLRYLNEARATWQIPLNYRLSAGVGIHF